PAQIAMPITARQVEATVIEHAHDLGHCAELQEHLEHEPQPLLNRHVGILQDHAARITNQADRQGERELSAFGFGEQAGGEAAANRVQFELRYRPLQAEEQPTVGATWVIDAISIRDEAAAQATDI